MPPGGTPPPSPVQFGMAQQGRADQQKARIQAHIEMVNRAREALSRQKLGAANQATSQAQAARNRPMNLGRGGGGFRMGGRGHGQQGITPYQALSMQMRMKENAARQGRYDEQQDRYDNPRLSGTPGNIEQILGADEGTYQPQTTEWAESQGDPSANEQINQYMLYILGQSPDFQEFQKSQQPQPAVNPGGGVSPPGGPGMQALPGRPGVAPQTQGPMAPQVQQQGPAPFGGGNIGPPMQAQAPAPSQDSPQFTQVMNLMSNLTERGILDQTKINRFWQSYARDLSGPEQAKLKDLIIRQGYSVPAGVSETLEAVQTRSPR